MLCHTLAAKGYSKTCISSCCLLGIIGAVLRVDFKVFTLGEHRQATSVVFISWYRSQEDSSTHLIYKAPRNGHRVILTHVQWLQQFTEIHKGTSAMLMDPLKDKGFNVRALQCFISHVPHKAAVLKVWQMCQNTGVHKMSNSNTVSNLLNMDYAAFSFKASRISETLSQSQPDLAVWNLVQSSSYIVSFVYLRVHHVIHPCVCVLFL